MRSCVASERLCILAEPAQTSALRGNKKRPKSDRADAKHLRELLMIGRLPESWIPPDYLLDLRSKVRLRHTLVDQRGEWQQRIRAVLYHHGLPHRRDLDLLTSEGRAWLDEVEVPLRWSTEISLGARAHEHPRLTTRNHSPPPRRRHT